MTKRFAVFPKRLAQPVSGEFLAARQADALNRYETELNAALEKINRRAQTKFEREAKQKMESLLRAGMRDVLRQLEKDGLFDLATQLNLSAASSGSNVSGPGLQSVIGKQITGFSQLLALKLFGGTRTHVTQGETSRSSQAASQFKESQSQLQARLAKEQQRGIRNL